MTINVYEQYFAAEGVFGGVERRGDFAVDIVFPGLRRQPKRRQRVAHRAELQGQGCAGHGDSSVVRGRAERSVRRVRLNGR